VKRRIIRRGPAAAALISSSLLLLCPTVACAQPAAGYWDLFDLPDASLPAEWQWTGYADGGGSFRVYDGAFTHVGGGAAYYVRPYRGRRDHLGGCYSFRVLGSHWAFAWRVSYDDPMSGRCLFLSHDDLSGPWAYTFAEVHWQTLDPGQYPGGAYMWNNWTAARVVRCETPGPLVGWHIVDVDDYQETHVLINVDGSPVFSEDHEFIPEGFEGLGCVASGEMTPAFDYLLAQWPDPVESSCWGAIKALFR